MKINEIMPTKPSKPMSPSTASSSKLGNEIKQNDSVAVQDEKEPEKVSTGTVQNDQGEYVTIRLDNGSTKRVKKSEVAKLTDETSK